MRIHRHRNKNRKPLVPKFKSNEEIQADEVRLIYGDSAEVVSLSKALELAQEAGLDLIEISPKAVPPVCKIMDYGSFKYQKEKEAKKQRASQKEVETKGIRLTFRIGDNDKEVRRKQAVKFLEKGNKVRIEMVLRGREKAYKDMATEKVEAFVESLRADFNIRIEAPLKPGGRGMQMIIAKE